MAFTTSSVLKGMSEFSTTDLIERIRNYQDVHTELKKSHHFVFDCPLDSTYRGKPDYVWFGVNPGSDCEDWKRSAKNSEETRDFDFQTECGRSSASANRMNKLRGFLGPERFKRTTHCELFFWCSKDTGSNFKNRFGYQFAKNPHWEFCCEINRCLIQRVQPNAVLAESLRKLHLYKDRLGLQPFKTHQCAEGKVLVEELRLDGGIPFLCFDHLSARTSSQRRGDIKKKVAMLLGG